VGPFTITGELGHGSAAPRRASQPRARIALKVIRPRTPGDDLPPGRCARRASSLNHPRVVRVFWAGIGAEVGISMELLRGQTLHQLVRANGPFSAKETLLIGSELCQAVAAVHGAQLLHGDIKANNVMRAQGGRTVLMDFGAGYDFKAGQGHAHRQTAGTPVYLAPEVHAGESASVASDIYSLGVLLFFLAANCYGAERRAGCRTRLRHGARRLLHGISQVVHSRCQRAIAERPEHRYATMGEFEAALDRALRNEDPIPPPSPVPWRQLALAAAAAVTLLGVGYLAWPIGSGNQEQVATGTPGAVQPPTISELAPAGAYQVEAAFYRHQGGADVRLQSGARVAPGDELSLRIQSSVPVYVYVVNEDDRGASYLLFPLPDQQLTNPLAAGARHEIPGMVNGERIRWAVDTAGGREPSWSSSRLSPPIRPSRACSPGCSAPASTRPCWRSPWTTTSSAPSAASAA
jgi:hypothetical protein